MKSKDILRDLVSFDTYMDKQNSEIMNYIQGLLENKGFSVDYKSKCLVMSIKNECKLGFIGHTDTVKSGNDWTINPLKLKEKDEKLYGLGTCDMKGGIAGILKAVLDTNWKKMKYGIKLFFTYDEEIDFNGIKEIIDNKLEIPQNVIIGEPTNNEVMNGSKGLLEFEIVCNGKSTHSSNPAKGENAIENCMNCLFEIKDFYEKIKSENDSRFEIPYTTMNIGKIEGGKSINIVPNICKVCVDFRVIKKEHRDELINKMNKLKDKYRMQYKIINDILPFITESGNNTTNFITEASFINSPNRMILGVGPINPHEADEYITIESLDKLVLQYKQIIDGFCK